MARLSFKRHRFPPDVIRHAVWLYFRFTLRFAIGDRRFEVQVSFSSISVLHYATCHYEHVTREIGRFGEALA